LDFIQRNLFFLTLVCTGVVFLAVAVSLGRKHPRKKVRIDVILLISILVVGSLGILFSWSEHQVLKRLAMALAALLVAWWIGSGAVPRWLVCEIVSSDPPQLDDEPK
jgi:hypothetical protein